MVLTLSNRLRFSVLLSSILNHPYTDTVLLASNSLLYTRNATNIVFLLISSASFRKQLSQLLRDRLCWCCRRRSKSDHDATEIQLTCRAAIIHGICCTHQTMCHVPMIDSPCNEDQLDHGLLWLVEIQPYLSKTMAKLMSVSKERYLPHFSDNGSS